MTDRREGNRIAYLCKGDLTVTDRREGKLIAHLREGDLTTSVRREDASRPRLEGVRASRCR